MKITKMEFVVAIAIAAVIMLCSNMINFDADSKREAEFLRMDEGKPTKPLAEEFAKLAYEKILYTERGKAVLFEITAYCGCEKCCGKWSDGRFANGMNIKTARGRTVAASRFWPFATELFIEGIGKVTVRDRGSAINTPTKLDLFFPTHEEALKFGRVYRKVWFYPENIEMIEIIKRKRMGK